MDCLVIYKRPADYPNHFVVRRWIIKHGSQVPEFTGALFDSLDEARAFAGPGRVCFKRKKDDDPCIVETWV